MLVPSPWGHVCSVGGGWAVVPLLTGAARAPRRPSHAGAGTCTQSFLWLCFFLGGRGRQPQSMDGTPCSPPPGCPRPLFRVSSYLDIPPLFAAGFPFSAQFQFSARFPFLGGFPFLSGFSFAAGFPFSAGFLFLSGFSFAAGFPFSAGFLFLSRFSFAAGVPFSDGFPFLSRFSFAAGFPFSDGFPFFAAPTQRRGCQALSLGRVG